MPEVEVGFRIWQVGKDYFLLKQQAKEERDRRIKSGEKTAHVSKGPDHDDHYTRREPCGVNKGKHPKKGHKGRNQQKSIWGK